jgi:clorobiocin biosynthesis protein CloN5
MERSMNVAEIEAEVVQFIGAQLLSGDDAGLNRTTPLLEWGLINSMEMKQLVGFLERRFAVSIAGQDVVAKNFRSVESIAELVRARSANTD